MLGPNMKSGQAFSAGQDLKKMHRLSDAGNPLYGPDLKYMRPVYRLAKCAPYRLGNTVESAMSVNVKHKNK